MKYMIDIENAMDLVRQIDASLNRIQVSGESVEHLYVARKLFVKLVDGIKEIPQEKKEVQSAN